MRSLLLCPVLFAISCGGGGGQPAVLRGIDPEPVYIQAGPAAVFQASEADRDTVWATWSGRGPLRISSIEVESGDSVSAGDTLALGIDSLASLELQQVSMSLEFATAAGSHPPGADSAGISRMMLQRDSLWLARSVAVVSPASGRAGAGLPAPGAIEMPGSRLVPVIVSPEAEFVLSAPPGAEVFGWPDSAGTAALVEGVAGSALYSGASVTGHFVFPGSVSLPRQALREDGLGAYVILEGGDSVSVERICISGDSVTVLPERPIEGIRIQGWAPAVEGI